MLRSSRPLELVHHLSHQPRSIPYTLSADHPISGTGRDGSSYFSPKPFFNHGCVTPSPHRELCSTVWLCDSRCCYCGTEMRCTSRCVTARPTRSLHHDESIPPLYPSTRQMIPRCHRNLFLSSQFVKSSSIVNYSAISTREEAAASRECGVDCPVHMRHSRAATFLCFSLFQLSLLPRGSAIRSSLQQLFANLYFSFSTPVYRRCHDTNT